MREKYKNPWGNHPGYIYLGRFSHMRTNYDLYAIKKLVKCRTDS